VADLVPVAAGVKFTSIVQLLLGATAPLAGHVLLGFPVSIANSVGSVPATAMLVILSVAVALALVTVTALSALVTPTDTLPKLMLFGDTVTLLPVPFKAAVCVPSLSLTLKAADSGSSPPGKQAEFR
jgi:hypothetical protein